MKHRIVILALGAAVLSACSSPPPEAPDGWTIVESGVVESFRGMSAASDQVAWASGTSGTVIRSLDGGAHWQRVGVPDAAELDLRDIEAFGPDEAVALSAGHPGRVYVTHDGGTSWQMTFEERHEGIFLDAMAFWDRRHGIAFGDPIDGRFVVITTDDGGESWQPLDDDARPRAEAGEAGFAASGSCLTVVGENDVWFGTGGAVARVFHSSDRGRTWTASATPLGQGKDSAGVFSVAFADRRHGVIVGGDYREPESAVANIAWTEDGGKSWQEPAAGLGSRPAGFRSAVRYGGDGRRTLVTVGSHGGDVSVDGGATWTSLGEPGFHALAGRDGATRLWAIGADGVAGRLP